MTTNRTGPPRRRRLHRLWRRHRGTIYAALAAVMLILAAGSIGGMECGMVPLKEGFGRAAVFLGLLALFTVLGAEEWCD